MQRDGSYQWYRVFPQKFIFTQSRYSLHLQDCHVHYHVHKIASSDYILRHFKPINSLTLYLCKSDFGITFSSLPMSPRYSLPFRFSN